MKVKILGLGVEVDWLLKIVFQALVKILDSLVKGENLADKQKMLVRTVDYLNKEWGAKWASETETSIDDEGVASIKETCADLAGEGEFSLVDIIPI